MLETKPAHTKGYLIAAVCICIDILICASTFAQDYHMGYDKGRLSLSAEKVDLKTILLGISRETNILIRFPAALQKQITINLSGVSLKNAFKRLLKGQSYAIIYSGSEKNAISEVQVLPEQSGPGKSVAPLPQSRYSNLIRNYNRRLDTLKARLTKADRGSDTEKRILRRIQSMERAVERLKNRP